MSPEPVRVTTIAREWGRIGCIGFLIGAAVAGLLFTLA